METTNDDVPGSSMGGSRGGAHPARAPPKIGKNLIFWRKIVIFHTIYPQNFRASLRNWEKYDFLA
jgi:hypothetical protein